MKRHLAFFLSLFFLFGVSCTTFREADSSALEVNAKLKVRVKISENDHIVLQVRAKGKNEFHTSLDFVLLHLLNSNSKELLSAPFGKDILDPILIKCPLLVISNENWSEVSYESQVTDDGTIHAVRIEGFVFIDDDYVHQCEDGNFNTASFLNAFNFEAWIEIGRKNSWNKAKRKHVILYQSLN
jgi:hypothetical protein